jgi:hypothetical protein
MIARRTVTHRRAMETMTRFLADTHDAAIPSEPERKPGVWPSGGSRRVPAEVGLHAGDTVTAIRCALDAFMVRRSEPAIAQNQLNAS